MTEPMDMNKLCEKCGHEIIPDEWAESGWGLGPHCGLGICSCDVGEGFPSLMKGDILIDRGYTACQVTGSETYGFRGHNIMNVQRPKVITPGGTPVWVNIWHRHEENKKD